MKSVPARSSSSLRVSGTATRKGAAIKITNREAAPVYVSVVRRRGREIIAPEKSAVRELGGRGIINFHRLIDDADDEEIVVVSSADRRKLREALRTAGTTRRRAGDVKWAKVKLSQSASKPAQSRAGKKSAERTTGRAAGPVAETASGQRRGGEGTGRRSPSGGGPDVPESPGGSGGQSPPPDPGDGDRQAYGLLECPEIVVVDQEFELVVGLTEDPDGADVSDAMTIFPEDTTIDVMVTAPGCSIRAGEKWRQSLPVRANELLPAVTMHLIVPKSTRHRPARTIKAVYSVPGRTLGVAIRSFAVAASKSEVSRIAPPQPAGTATIPVPTGPRNDLEIVIQQFDEDPPGTLRWQFTSVYPDVTPPEKPLRTPIGNEPRQFAENLLEYMDTKENDEDLAEAVRGFGLAIANCIPRPVWDALYTVAAATPARQVPQVQILSEEPFVPWELAVTEPALLPGGEMPAILGAQVCIGRWVLADEHQRPKLPPPNELTVKKMAVVSGRYKMRYRLKEAEREAAELREKYSAEDVAAVLPAIRNCLKGKPRAEAIHFALHGRYSPADIVKEGILLVDQKVLGPIAVSGYKLDQQSDARPLVFLNACQMGMGNSLLGTYSGMGSAFLTAGAAAVVAPLWSVDDGKAHAIAIKFYEEVLENGVSPAEFIRGLRASFREDADVVDATPLAYQFFGHPQLKVLRGGT